MNIQDAIKNADTLSQATTLLHEAGYTTNFMTKEDCIACAENDKTFKPEELVIEASCRFEGQSNPSDSSELFALKANDGTRGTLVLSYGAQHSQDQDVVKDIPFAEDVISS